MLIGPQLAYLHVPKCAGQWLSSWLAGCNLGRVVAERGPGWRHAGYHDAEPMLRGRAILSSVRNPWNWYASWYHHTAPARPQDRPEGFHVPLSEGTGGSFREVVGNALVPSRVLPSGYVAMWPTVSGPHTRIVEVTERLGIGLYSYFLLRVLIRDVADLNRIGRGELMGRFGELQCADAIVTVERIRTEAPEALRSLGFHVRPSNVASAASMRRQNTAAARTGPRHYGGTCEHLYDRELLELVREREWLVAELFGYEEPDEPATSSPWIRPSASRR